jgi:hypothetical protein
VCVCVCVCACVCVYVRVVLKQMVLVADLRYYILAPSILTVFHVIELPVTVWSSDPIVDCARYMHTRRTSPSIAGVSIVPQMRAVRPPLTTYRFERALVQLELPFMPTTLNEVPPE